MAGEIIGILLAFKNKYIYIDVQITSPKHSKKGELPPGKWDQLLRKGKHLLFSVNTDLALSSGAVWLALGIHKRVFLMIKL